MKKSTKKNPLIKEEPMNYSKYTSSGITGFFLPRKDRKLRTNRYMVQTSVVIILLFISLVSYMVWFTGKESKKVISSPYNRRTETLKKQILRGNIISADGEILAKTELDDEGNEKRVYPFDSIFAHVVGYSSHGKGGIESAFNYELMSSHIDILSQIKNATDNKKNQGDELITTLDSSLQEAAYNALDGYRGSIVAIEPSTGKVRAMVSKPDFNPNYIDDIWSDIVNDESSTVLLNRATQGLYPPGSTYKVVTALEYIMEHPYSYKEFEYTCEGETIVDSVHINCYHNKEHGKETLSDAFANSCNTAFVNLGKDLDRKKYIKINEDLLFSTKIDSDLSIAKSRFHITDKSQKYELPQTVIGQGNTLMTPLHNALIMCAVANNGRMMRPMFAEKINNVDGETVKTYNPSDLMKIKDTKAIKEVQKMLRKVVTDGTGTSLYDEDYTVAGKTGTAENEKEQPHSWFVGYSNVENPDLVVCVIVENSGAGSEYAAPIAKKIFNSYYDHELNEKYR